MLNDFNCSCPVYIACGYTDLRRGIDGLASMVSTQFQMDPFQTALFLFCGRKRDRIKALYWEGDGFLLLYKRLENGSFQWPRTKDEVRKLTPQQYGVFLADANTAIENKLDPYRYLTWLMGTAANMDLTQPELVQQLLPWNASESCKAN